MVITKKKLEQYSDLREEIKDIQLQIKKNEDEIAKLFEEGTVADKVTGGFGGVQGFKIEGFPVAEYERRKKILRKIRDRLTRKENDLLELTEKIEEFIDSIPVCRDRRIFNGIYIKNKTQQEMANELCVDRSLISKIIGKYL